MKKIPSIFAFFAILTFLTACGEKEDKVTSVQTNTEETEQEEIVSQTTDDFPVTVYYNGEKIKIADLSEASQAAVRWVYDFFNTEDITSEDEFYDMLKEKYRKGETIPESIDTPEKAIAGYGSEMLPKFETGRVVESIVVYTEVPEGLLITVPLYVKLAGEENMRAVAIAYAADTKEVLGADRKFPMALD